MRGQVLDDRADVTVLLDDAPAVAAAAEMAVELGPLVSGQVAECEVESLGVGQLNVVLPTGLSSPRAYFNLDWITLVVMIVVALVGVIFSLIAHSGKELSAHRRDDIEETLTGHAVPSRTAQEAQDS